MLNAIQDLKAEVEQLQQVSRRADHRNYRDDLGNQWRFADLYDAMHTEEALREEHMASHSTDELKWGEFDERIRDIEFKLLK